MGSLETAPLKRPSREHRPRVLVVGPAGGHTGGVAMTNDILLRSALADRYELLRLDTSRGTAGRGKAQTAAPINFVYFARQMLQLLGILLFRRPDAIHQPITSRLAFRKEVAFLALARLFGVRRIAHLHGGAFPDYFRSRDERGRRAIAKALRRCDLLIALSDGGRRFLLSEVDPSLAVAVVPTTIDPEFAREAALLERAPRDTCRVLMIGRLGVAKGLLDLLHAVPLVGVRIPTVEFLLAGDVESDPAIEEARARLGPGARVAFLGQVRGEAKLACFRDADILVLPSHTENLPIAVLEGMAAGLALVVTPVGALPEVLVADRHALFVPPREPALLAQAIGALALDPEARRAMGRANRERFHASYRPTAMIDGVDAAYRRVLALGDESPSEPARSLR
jgi:glycosyltransferase involved in cell wall biosynthesis